ncbi:MAG: radical SAM protein, partial [Pseudomonadota bacterium]
MTTEFKSADRPFGIYVHWPFCESKCPYCDFNSHVRHDVVDQAAYRAAFSRELAWTSVHAPDHTVASVFFGGGTPSLMAPETVHSILSDIARHWPMADDVEITLEANPSSVEAERFAGYAAAGVNRVSLGLQALNDADLKT